MFCKKGALKNFAISTGKQLCWGVVFEYWETFKHTSFYSTPLVAASISKTLSNICDGAFYVNNEELLALEISTTDVWRTLKCDSGEWIRSNEKQSSRDIL